MSEATAGSPGRPRPLGVTPSAVGAFLVLAYGFLKPMFPTADPDVWWHLRTGAFILDSRSIPRVDPFSWPAAGRRWTAHEWGSQVVLRAVDQAFGPLGLRILLGTAVLVSLLLIYKALTPLDIGGWTRTGVLLVATLLTSGAWTVRPALFSLPLLALTLETLLAYYRGVANRRVWLLVPLILLWANLHGVFVAGVLLLWAFAIGLSLGDRSAGRRLLVVAAAATAAGCLNPAGVLIYLHPLHVAQVSTGISEWQPTSVRDPVGAVFALLCLATPFVLAMRRLVPPTALVLPAVGFAYMGLAAEKNVWMAGFVFAPLLGFSLRGLLPADSAVTRREGLALATVCVAAGVIGIAATFNALSVSQPYELLKEETFPVAAADVVSQLPDGRMVNPYDWGGYLLWKVPDRQVSIDGRNDMYGHELLTEHDVVEELRPGWREYLDDNDVQYVLGHRNGALGEALRLLPEQWQLVHEDSKALVFERVGTSRQPDQETR